MASTSPEAPTSPPRAASEAVGGDSLQGAVSRGPMNTVQGSWGPSQPGAHPLAPGPHRHLAPSLPTQHLGSRCGGWAGAGSPVSAAGQLCQGPWVPGLSLGLWGRGGPSPGSWGGIKLRRTEIRPCAPTSEKGTLFVCSWGGEIPACRSPLCNSVDLIWLLSGWPSGGLPRGPVTLSSGAGGRGEPEARFAVVLVTTWPLWALAAARPVAGAGGGVAELIKWALWGDGHAGVESTSQKKT